MHFSSIRAELAHAAGLAGDQEDWERGIAYQRRQALPADRLAGRLRLRGRQDAEHYAATKAGAIQSRRPGSCAQARKLSDGTFLIVYDNVAKAQGDAEPRIVFDLVTQNPGDPKEGVLVTLGVPASDAARGLKLMALLKQNTPN